MNYLKLLGKFFVMNFKDWFSYRLSAFTKIFIMLFNAFLQPLLIIFLYNISNGIPGWNLYELLLFEGAGFLAWGLAATFIIPMVWEVGWDIDYGNFDLTLLKPLKVIPSILLKSVNPSDIPNIITGSIIMIISVIKLNIQINPVNLAIFILLLLLSTGVYFGIAGVIIGLSFKFFKSHNLIEVFFQINHLNQYPLTIFKNFTIPFFLTFIFPVAIADFYPVSYLLGRINNPIILLNLILISSLFTLIGVFSIKKGVKYYSSAGG